MKSRVPVDTLCLIPMTSEAEQKKNNPEYSNHTIIVTAMHINHQLVQFKSLLPEILKFGTLY